MTYTRPCQLFLAQSSGLRLSTCRSSSPGQLLGLIEVSELSCGTIAPRLSVGFKGVYGADGRLNSKFLLSTKEVLASIANLADELQGAFPLHLGKTISGISRTYAYLHLLYHQVSITLCFRPPFWLLTLRLSVSFLRHDHCSSVSSRYASKAQQQTG